MGNGDGQIDNRLILRRRLPNIEDGVAKLPDRSFFAGSIGTMDRALRFAVKTAEIPLNVASKMLSLTPSKLMGIDDKKGSIALGKDADFLLVDKELNVEKIYVNGELAALNS